MSACCNFNEHIGWTVRTLSQFLHNTFTVEVFGTSFDMFFDMFFFWCFVQNRKPSLVAFNMLIDACGKAGRDEEAVQSYADLIDSRYRPNAVTYTSLISAVAQAGRYEKADELYRRMLDDRVEPTGHTYATMINACSGRGWTRYGHEVPTMLHLYMQILYPTPLFMQLMQCFVVQNEYIDQDQL